jgi:predicted GNAT family acetyltransferase
LTLYDKTFDEELVIIPGVELSCSYDGGLRDILGYGKLQRYDGGRKDIIIQTGLCFGIDKGVNMDWKYGEGRIYGIDEKGELLAEATYSIKGNGDADINHTYVAPFLRGQGIAGDMMTVVATHLREKGLKATASCSYANAWLKKNRETYADVISDELSDEAPSCRIDGKH